MKQDKKILICTEYFWPYGDKSTGYYLTEIANKLADHYEVEVCTVHNSTLNYTLSEKEKKDYRITRIGQSSLNTDGYILMAIKHILLGLKFFLFQLRNIKESDELFIVTTPVSLIICSWLTKFFKKCNLTVLIYDIFPESLVGVGALKETNIIYRPLLRVYNNAYSSADTLISIGEDMTEYLHKKLPNFRGSIVDITNWSETKEIVPTEKVENEILIGLGLRSKVVFTFAGNIGRAQNIPFLLDSMQKVISEEAHFLFLGSGAMAREVKKVADKEKSNITYGGSYGRVEQNNFLGACDVAIVSLSKGMSGLGVPSKAYNILASGKPILFIGDKNSEIANLIRENSIGWIVPQGDQSRFIETVEEIIEKPKAIVEKGAKSRQLAVDKYSQELILSKYVELFKIS